MARVWNSRGEEGEIAITTGVEVVRGEVVEEGNGEETADEALAEARTPTTSGEVEAVEEDPGGVATLSLARTGCPTLRRSCELLLSGDQAGDADEQEAGAAVLASLIRTGFRRRAAAAMVGESDEDSTKSTFAGVVTKDSCGAATVGATSGN